MAKKKEPEATPVEEKEAAAAPAEEKAKDKNMPVIVFRDVLPGDHDGTIDKDFLDEAGMKKVQIRNANKGVIITLYSEENERTEKFCSVDDMVLLLTAQMAS